MPNFVLLGAAGFVAPRHMKAIKEIGGNLLAVMDPHDSVGVIDGYFKDCKYFREFERFDRLCDKSIRAGVPIDYVVVCSPNYLHDSHIRFGLRLGADVICEKPVVANERNLDALLALEKETGRSVWVMFQLRMHPEVARLREQYSKMDWPGPQNNPYLTATVDYATPRGEWYLHSWKGDVHKSGGLATNIGCHLFDVLSLLFGNHTAVSIEKHSPTEIWGSVSFEKADTNFRLSVNKTETPKRLFCIGDENVDLSGGFGEMHTQVYKAVMVGTAPRLADARESVRITEEIRRQVMSVGGFHP